MSTNSVRSIASIQYWDATKAKPPNQLLQESFQLAYFLFPDRSIAIDIVLRALGRLRMRGHREMKRLYWRDKHWERPVRRVARTDADMMQWLTMFESERHERTEEEAGESSLNQMTIRYIKYLVQLTTTLSSFHVNVALTRLLHNYSTAEAQSVYEILTGRFLSSDIYRRAKAGLMNKLAERFDGFIKTTRAEHGELRFETADDQKPWLALVDQCLKMFTPWSTQPFCSQFANVVSDNRKSPSLLPNADVDLNEMEMRCCHILIEPACYNRLLNGLHLASPATKLALPRFFMSEKHTSNDDDGMGRTPAKELSQEELDRIQQRLAAWESRQRSMDPQFVTILVDGHMYGRMDLHQDKQFVFELEGGAVLVEIRANDGLEDVTLATHFISYVDEAFEFTRATAGLGQGKMQITVSPSGEVNSYPAKGSLALHYRPAFQVGKALARWGLFQGWSKTRLYALTVVATLLLGWSAIGSFYAHKNKLLERELEKSRRNQPQLAPTIARAVISYMLIRDDQRVRGAGNAGIPEISLRRYPPAVSLQLPVIEATAPEGYKVELKTFTGDQTLMTESFLNSISTDVGPAVEIVFSAELLKPDIYYTVFLYSRDRTDRFTFKAVATE